MKEIQMIGGQVALVEDADVDKYDLVNGYSWYAAKSHHGCAIYARAYVRGSHPRRTVYLHRLLLNAPEGVEVDHENRNGLDCQRHNIRLATNRQNQYNKVKQLTTRGGATPSSRFKGVSWHNGSKKWEAGIRVGQRRVYLGLFTSEANAALAYNRAASQWYGAFARLNVL